MDVSPVNHGNDTKQHVLVFAANWRLSDGFLVHFPHVIRSSLSGGGRCSLDR